MSLSKKWWYSWSQIKPYLLQKDWNIILYPIRSWRNKTGIIIRLITEEIKFFLNQHSVGTKSYSTQVPSSWSQTARRQRSWSQTSPRCFSNWRFTWTSKDCWTTQQSKILNLGVVRKYCNFCYSSSDKISLGKKSRWCVSLRKLSGESICLSLGRDFCQS